MILDGQNYFSNLALGDSPTAVADNVSAYVIDQQGKGSIFSEGGGARIAPWLMVLVQAAGVSGGGGTIQVVLQDSPDNVTWTDRALGAATAAASVTVGSHLYALRIGSAMARYIRVVYRIGTAVFTAGTYISFLTLEKDLFDLSERQSTGTVSEPTGAMDEAVNQGVLNQ